MKKIILAFFVLSLLCLILTPARGLAAFNSSRIMDDPIFNNSNSMNAGQIDAFLNSFSSSCISPNKGFSSPDVTGYNPSQGFLYGSNTSAGNVIYHASQAYDLNPQVLLATLQKEQSLVSGSAGCHYETPPTLNPCPNPPYGTSTSCVTACQYAGGCVYIAMGYDCPYYCVPSSNGFSPQIIKAAWKLKFVQQRSLGNYNWNVQKPGWDNSDDPLTDYGGYMTQGLFKRNASSAAVNFDGYRPVNNNSLSVHLDTGATASLYSYTPFTNGNQSFVNIFENWFGSTKSGQCLTNLTSVSTDVQFRKYKNKIDVPVFQINSGSGTGCVESHIWGPGFTSWQVHIASASPSITSPDTQVFFADLDGAKQDYPIVMGLLNTSTGKIEAHVLNKDMQSFLVHAASNQNTISLTDNSVDFADLNGDGKEEPIIVSYQNTGSGMIEFHGWSNGMQGWLYHTATNRASISPTDNYVRFADINGDGRVEAILVSANNTGSGKVEFHIWNPGQSSWQSHIVSNMPSINPSDGRIVFADVDGNGTDEAVLIGLHNTGSGKVEFHIWNPGQSSWRFNIASNQPTL